MEGKKRQREKRNAERNAEGRKGWKIERGRERSKRNAEKAEGKEG